MIASSAARGCCLLYTAGAGACGDDTFVDVRDSAQVKREVMDESFAQQARLESAVSALSDTILQHKSRLSEFKEALECCICFERTVECPLASCILTSYTPRHHLLHPFVAHCFLFPPCLHS